MSDTTNRPVSEHAQRREAVRAILKPSPVRLHHIPNWLRLRMIRAFGCPGRDTAAWPVLWHAVGERRRWLDHFGSTLSHGRQVFVSEPYGFSAESAADLEAFCRPMGVKWSVDSNSEWNPGSTVRVSIEEPEE